MKTWLPWWCIVSSSCDGAVGFVMGCDIVDLSGSFSFGCLDKLQEIFVARSNFDFRYLLRDRTSIVAKLGWMMS